MIHEILNALVVEVLVINCDFLDDSPKQPIKQLFDSNLLISRKYPHVFFVFFSNNFADFVVALDLHLLVDFKPTVILIFRVGISIVDIQFSGTNVRVELHVFIFLVLGGFG